MPKVKECATCKIKNKVSKGSVICIGCNTLFCTDHHKEHRQLIQRDFEDLIHAHDVLKERILMEFNQSKGAQAKMLEKVDKWEKAEIDKIRQIGVETKSKIIQIVKAEKNVLDEKMLTLSKELKLNQSQDFVESDIDEWRTTLSNCEKIFTKNLISNEDFINLNITNIDWNNFIQVRKSNSTTGKMAIHQITSSRYEEQSTSKYTTKSRHDYDDDFAPHYNERTNSTVSFQDFDYGSDTSYDDDDGGGCIHENCVVSLDDGSLKSVKDIRQGDRVRTMEGSSATIMMIVKTVCPKKRVRMVRLENDLLVTPWHPVQIDDQWKFPCKLKKIEQIPCEAIYNFVLDKDHVVIVNGVKCITLGHDMKGDVVEHPYFGTKAIIEDMRAFDILNNGYIILRSGSWIRDPKTKLIMGFDA